MSDQRDITDYGYYGIHRDYDDMGGVQHSGSRRSGVRSPSVVSPVTPGDYTSYGNLDYGTRQPVETDHGTARHYRDQSYGSVDSTSEYQSMAAMDQQAQRNRGDLGEHQQGEEQRNASDPAYEANRDSHNHLLGQPQPQYGMNHSFYGKPRYFRPFVTRVPWLCCLFLLTLGMIATLEVALHRLPARTSDGAFNTLVNKTRQEAKEKLGARAVYFDPMIADGAVLVARASPSSPLPASPVGESSATPAGSSDDSTVTPDAPPSTTETEADGPSKVSDDDAADPPVDPVIPPQSSVVGENRLPVGDGEPEGTPQATPGVDARLPVGDGPSKVSDDDAADPPVDPVIPPQSSVLGENRLPVGDGEPEGTPQATPGVDARLPVGDGEPEVPDKPPQSTPPAGARLPVGDGTIVTTAVNPKDRLPVGGGAGAHPPGPTIVDGNKRLPVGDPPAEPTPEPTPEPSPDPPPRTPDLTVTADKRLPVGESPTDETTVPGPTDRLPVGDKGNKLPKPAGPGPTIVDPDRRLPVGDGPPDPTPPPDPGTGRSKPPESKPNEDDGDAPMIGGGTGDPLDSPGGEPPYDDEPKLSVPDDSRLPIGESPKSDGPGQGVGSPKSGDRLPVGNPGEDARLPVGGGGVEPTAFYIPGSRLPVGTKPTAAPEMPAPGQRLPVNDGGPKTQAAVPIGVTSGKGNANGVEYEVGPSGVAIYGKTYPTDKPQIVDLENGQSLFVDADGKARIGPSLTVIGGKTYDLATPTSDSLANGKSVIIGKDGKATVKGKVNDIEYEDRTTAVVISGTTFATAKPTTATLANGDTVTVDEEGHVDVHGKAVPVEQETTWHGISRDQYVIGAFLPTIFAVVFSIPWYIVDTSIKEIEPFYQLMRTDGAGAIDSVCMDYSASIMVAAAYNSFFRGHLVVFWSSAVNLVVLFLAPLASEAVFIGFKGRCTATTGPSACFPMLSVYPLAARFIEGILAFVAIMTVFIAIATLRRKSGVYANPFSIGGLATLFQHPGIVNDFRQLDPDIPTTRALTLALRGRRYRIGPYSEPDGSSAYGITLCQYNPMVAAPLRGDAQSLHEKKQPSVSVTAVGEGWAPKRNRRQHGRYIHLASLVGFGLLIAGFLAMILYYNQTSGDTGFERFMNSQTFGSRFLFTASGVLIKLFWSHLDDETRRLEPFRNLSTKQHGALAVDSVLYAPHKNPFTGCFASLYHLRFFPASTSLLTMLCEPLIVALSNIPYSAGVSDATYRVCHWISVCILSLMLLGVAWAFLRARGVFGLGGPDLPGLVREPDSIASILLYICGSHMLPNFAGMGSTPRKERDRAVASWGKRYGIGSVVGLDGIERDGIDEKRNVEQGWVVEH